MAAVPDLEDKIEIEIKSKYFFGGEEIQNSDGPQKSSRSNYFFQATFLLTTKTLARDCNNDRVGFI